MYAAILEGEIEDTEEAMKKCLEAKEDAEGILKMGCIASLDEVGRLFKNEEYCLPEMLLSARAMKAGMVILRPALQAAVRYPDKSCSLDFSNRQEKRPGTWALVHTFGDKLS